MTFRMKISISLFTCLVFLSTGCFAETDNQNISTTSQSASTDATSNTQQASRTVLPVQIYHENHVEIALAGGVAGVHTRDSHMQVTRLERDTLAQTNSYRWDTTTGQVGVGYVFYFVDGPRLSNDLRWFPTFEPMLNLYYSSLDINGDIYQFNNVLLNDLRYTTSIKNTRLLLDGILTIVSKCNYSFYALLGIGEGWSRINYHDRLGDNTRIDLDSEHETNVIWEWGAGLNYAYNRRVSVSLEYVFTDLGRMHTSSTGITNDISSPQLAGADFQVTTQAILLGLHVALGK